MPPHSIKNACHVKFAFPDSDCEIVNPPLKIAEIEAVRLSSEDCLNTDGDILTAVSNGPCVLHGVRPKPGSVAIIRFGVKSKPVTSTDASPPTDMEAVPVAYFTFAPPPGNIFTMFAI